MTARIFLILLKTRGHSLRLPAIAVALRGPRLQCLQRLQVLAWLESNSLSGRNIHFGTCAWISSDARFAWFHGEHAESAQLDPIVGFEGILHTVEDRIHRLFRFRLAYSRPVYD